MCEIQKKKLGGGGQGGCEWRSEAFVKIQKKKIYFFFLGGGGRVRGSDWGVSGWMGTENWSFCENSKKKNIFFFFGGWGSGWGVRVDVN